MQLQNHSNASTDHPSIFGKTSLWTVAFSTLGGVYKAHASPHLMLDTITLDGSVTVVCYAFLSAVVGYATKKGLDFLFKSKKD